jgi:hypothetical protein
MLEAMMVTASGGVLDAVSVMVTSVQGLSLEEAMNGLVIVRVPKSPKRFCRSVKVPWPVALVIALTSPAWGLGAPLMSTLQAP